MRKSLVFALVIILVYASTSFAGPAAPGIHTLTQPDGTTFQARLRGDEFQKWTETASNGYSVVRNEGTGYWEYAQQGPDGSLTPSGVVVDALDANAPSTLQKGLRPARDLQGEQAQRTALGASGAAVSNWVPKPVSGQKKVLVVLVNFDGQGDAAKGRQIQTSPAGWSNSVFSTTPGDLSVSNYYRDNSFGALSIVPASHTQQGSPAGVVSVTLSLPHPYYGTSETVWVPAAINAAAAYINLNSVDANGNGIIDDNELVVYFIAAGYEGSGAAIAPNVWAHTATGSIRSAGKTFSHYSVSGELDNQGKQQSIGIMTHEMGHLICGLPDLYDTTYWNAGMGAYSLMASGMWGASGDGEAYGARPVALDAWSREYLGWTAPVTPVGDGKLVLGPALSGSGGAYKLMDTSVSATEYWLVENRYATGWDLGIKGLVRDIDIPNRISDYQGGLLITHIDNSVGSLAGNDMDLYRAGGHQGVMPVVANPAYCDLTAAVDPSGMRPESADCQGTPHTMFFSGDATSHPWFYYIYGDGGPMPTYYGTAQGPKIQMDGISAVQETMTADLWMGNDNITNKKAPTDTTKPVVSFVIPKYSKTLKVTFTTFLATDVGSGIGGYIVSDDRGGHISTPDNTSVWSTIKPTSITFTSDGTYVVIPWAKDKAGNISDNKSYVVTVDTTKPTVDSFSAPAITNKLKVTGITFSGSDTGSGINGYMINESSTAPPVSSANWKAAPPDNYTAKASGKKTLYAWVKDKAGNVSTSRTASVLIDNTKPVISAFTVRSPINSLTIPITKFTVKKDNGAPIVGYMITVDNQTAPLDNSSGWSATVPDNLTVISKGTRTLRAYAKDNASNVSLAKAVTCIIDLDKPVITKFEVYKDVSNQLSIKITRFIATDNGTGVGFYLITDNASQPDNSSKWKWKAAAPTSFTIKDNGTVTIYAYVMDKAGNISDNMSATVLIDDSNPIVTVFSVPAFSNTLKVANITIAGIDNGTGQSGVVAYAISESPLASSITRWLNSPPDNYTFTSTGRKTLYGWVKDNASNISAPVSATVIIDMTKPTVDTFKVSGSVYKVIGGYVVPIINSLTIPVQVSASDKGGSGLAGYVITVDNTTTPDNSSDWNWSPSAPTGVTVASDSTVVMQLRAWAIDNASNVSLAKTIPVLVDTTKPTVNTFSVIDPIAPSRLASVTDFTGTDNGSGVYKYLVTDNATTPDINTSGWSTTKPTTCSITHSDNITDTIYAYIMDRAGNISDAMPAVVNVDTTKPTVNLFIVTATGQSLDVTIDNLTGSDNGSFVSGVYMYLITEDNATAPDNTTVGCTGGWQTSAPATCTVTDNSTTTIFAYIMDRAGNISNAMPAVVNVDTTKPTVDLFIVTPIPQSLDVTIDNFTGSDSGSLLSGVYMYLITEDNATAPDNTTVGCTGGWQTSAPVTCTVTDNSTTTLYAYIMDRAGNISNYKSASVTVVYPAPGFPKLKTTSIPARPSAKRDNANATGPAPLLAVPRNSYRASQEQLLKQGGR